MNIIKKPLFAFLFGKLVILPLMILHATNPVNAATRALSFAQALSIADSVNPEIRNGLSRIRESQERKKQIASNILPQVTASASYGRLGTVPPGKKYLLGNSNNDVYVDVTVKQLLFAGGRYGNQISAAETLTVIEKQKLSQSRGNIRLAVARAYLEAVKTRFSLGVQRDLVERTRAQAEIADLLFRGGKTSNLDVVRLRTQLLIAGGQLSTLESQLKTRQYQLAQTIGVTDTCSVTDSVLTDSLESLPVDMEHLISELKETPEMKAAQAAHENALLNEKIAKADYYPTLSLNGGYNREENSFFPGNPNWIIGTSISIPLYRGGGTGAQTAQAYERTLQADNVISQTWVSLTTRLRTAIELLKDKKDKISVARQIVESAKETSDIAELRYSTGKLSAFELIDAQNTYARAQQDLFSTRVDYRIAIEEIAVICPSILNAEETLK